MKAIIKFCFLAISAGALAQSATLNTTVTVNATGTLSSTAVTATGTATMPNVFSGTAAFSGTLPLYRRQWSQRQRHFYHYPVRGHDYGNAHSADCAAGIVALAECHDAWHWLRHCDRRHRQL